MTLGFSDKGVDILDLDFGTAHNVTSMYHNGPLVNEADFPANVSILARFRAQGNPWGLGRLEWAINASTPAITSTAYGAGHVVLNSPHPEHLPRVSDSPKIYSGELEWVAPRNRTV